MDLKPQCQYCEKTFSGKSNLLKHLTNVHKVQNKDDKAYLCHESGCDSKFPSSKKLRDHLKMMHDLKFEEEYLEFKDIAAFNCWKNEYEEKEDVNFIKTTGVKHGLNGEKKYYLNCHRSGYGKIDENSTKIRRGSHKLGFYCTSSMTVVEKVDGKVTCNVYSTHYGHPKEIGKLNLTKNEKQRIASKLLQKVNADDIMKDIRDDFIHKDKPSRIHLTTKEDIKNIKRKYNLYGPQQCHQDDATSVSIMLREMEAEGSNNPVLAYKFQGEKGTGSLKELHDSDVFFVIQHPIQRAMLQKFVHTICIDSTHGTNRYGFYLITLLVIDEYQEGFPVAFCLCNREDRSLLKVFFSIVKDKCAVDLNATVFMSDDAPAFYNAWEDVFGPVKHKLLCAWHVERAIRMKLQANIKDKDLLYKVYQSINLLLEETNKETFEEMLENIKDLFQSSNVEEFGKYFLKTYGNKMHEIAACYRQKLGINTNMHLESFHRVFKYNFLKAKVNNRMDLCIFQIIEFIKNASLERVKKIERGKLTFKLRLISNRHKRSLAIDFSSVDQKNGNYVVNSSSTNKQYTVQVNASKCHCKVRCHPCGYCVHDIACTCEDYLIRNVLCKHCHLVIRKIKLFEHTEDEFEDVNLENEGSIQSQMGPEEMTDANACTNIHNNIHNLTTVKNTDLGECKLLLENISAQLCETNPESGVIKKACSMLRDVNNFLMASSSTINTEKFPSVKCETIKVTPQRSFYATKKRSSRKKNKLPKGTSKEKEEIRAEILNVSCSDSAPVNTADHIYSMKEKKIPTNRKNRLMVITKEQQKLLKEIVNCNLHVIFKNEDSISPDCIKNSDDIPDSVIDSDLNPIKKLLTDETWLKLKEIVEKKKENWCCSMCSYITTKRDMVQCDTCLNWNHFECAEIEGIQEDEKWSCYLCKSKT